MKKILPIILIFVFILSGFLAPISALAGDVGPHGGSTPGGLTKKNDCGTWDAITGNLGDCLLMGMANGMLELVSYTLWMSGTLLDYSISFSLDLSSYLKNTQGIELAWGTFRDLANIFFIFILLYISIATILQIGGHGARELLVKVILIALLINFSLFITKTVIDSSNILALQFYSQMTTGPLGGSGDNGLSDKFVSGLKLTGVYKSGANGKPANLEVGKTLTLILFASIFILITAFIFLAAAFMFISRTAVLVFLMILSPLAFVGMILPGTQGLSKKWWSQLFNQSFFAPIYLGLTWVVLKIIEAGGTGGKTFADALMAQNSGSISIVFNFMLLSALMLGSLAIAKQMGAHGANTMIEWGHSTRKWAQGAVGRNTVGRGASAIANSDTMKRFAARNPRVGNFAFKSLDGVAGTSFGGAKGGYDKARKDSVKQKVATGKRVGKGKLGEPLLMKDKSGNTIKDKDGKDLTTTEQYIRELEKQKKVKKSYKGKGYKQSRVDREAAQELRKKKTNIQKLIEEIKEEEKTETKEKDGKKTVQTI